jgi:hypothetical protein
MLKSAKKRERFNVSCIYKKDVVGNVGEIVVRTLHRTDNSVTKQTTVDK